MDKSKNFEKALNFTLVWEGGLSDNPADYGGKTMMGVTQATLNRAYAYKLVGHKDVKQLTRDEAVKIYERMVWLPCRADVMPHPLCVIHFDTAVMRGSGGAGKILQFTLNGLFHCGLVIDGRVGPATLKALNMYWKDSERAVCTRYLAQREAHHRLRAREDPSQMRFLGGWLNRLNDLRKYTEGALQNG